MAWVRIDENFAEHPKVTQVGLEGLALMVIGLCYANRHLTDGYVPADRLVFLTGLSEKRTQQLARRLLDAGLWDLDAGGYLIHDYLEYQPSRKQVEAERQAKHQVKVNAGRAGAQKRWHSNGSST